MRNRAVYNVLTFLFVVAAGWPGSLLAGQLPTVASLQSRLAVQIQKMIDAGHLAPGICYFEQHYSGEAIKHGYELDDYWHNPGQLVYTLAVAIPQLPEEMKPAAKAYLESEFALYPPHTYVHIGPGGALREITPRPAEFGTKWPVYYDQRTGSAKETINWGPAGGPPPWTFPPFNIYACWKYAGLFPGAAAQILPIIRNKITRVPDNREYLLIHPSILNAFIAGYYGLLGLQDMVGEPRSPQVQGWLQEALLLRLQSLALDPRSLPGAEAGGFIYLIPELGEYLSQNAHDRVKEVLDYQSWAAPYWHIARAEEITRVAPNRKLWEGYHSHIYETSSQFLARAYALKWSPQMLERYLDAPAAYRGDLTYIQNLVAVLQLQRAPAAPANVQLK